MENANVTIRMNKQLKKQADQIFEELGMSFTTAINLFVRQYVRDRRIPFAISLEPNQTTINALNELKAMMSNKEEYKRYDSFAEAMEDINEECLKQFYLTNLKKILFLRNEDELELYLFRT